MIDYQISFSIGKHNYLLDERFYTPYNQQSQLRPPVASYLVNIDFIYQQTWI